MKRITWYENRKCVHISIFVSYQVTHFMHNYFSKTIANRTQQKTSNVTLKVESSSSMTENEVTTLMNIIRYIRCKTKVNLSLFYMFSINKTWIFQCISMILKHLNIYQLLKGKKYWNTMDSLFRSFINLQDWKQKTRKTKERITLHSWVFY